MNNYILFLAAVLVLVATIGFGYTTVIEHEIKKLQAQLSSINYEFDVAKQELDGGLNTYDKGLQEKNQAELLQELNPKSTNIGTHNRSSMILVNQALVKIAMGSGQSPSSEQIQQWQKISNYEDLMKGAFFPTLTRAQTYMQEHLNQKKVIADKIRTREDTKIKVHKIAMLLNSMGLLLGAFSRLFDSTK